MFLKAAELFPIDITTSLMVGDNVSDLIQLQGLQCMLVKSDIDLSSAPAGTPIFENHKDLQNALKPIIGP